MENVYFQSRRTNGCMSALHAAAVSAAAAWLLLMLLLLLSYYLAAAAAADFTFQENSSGELVRSTSTCTSWNITYDILGKQSCTHQDIATHPIRGQFAPLYDK